MVDPETEKLLRDVAGFSPEIYNRLAQQSPFYKKIMDVARRWVDIQDGRISAPKPEIQTSQSSGADVADQIRKLADLKAEGLLTEEEFTVQKRKLLSL